MAIDQEFKLISILIVGLILGIAFILLKEKACKWLLRYGGLLVILGLGGTAISGSKFQETLFLIDASGLGRAYVVGCMLIFGGFTCAIWNVVKWMLGIKGSDS